MLELAHALTGGVIAYKIGNPFLALPLSFLSHFAIDLLPHWNPHIAEEKKKYGHISHKSIIIIAVDCLIGLSLGLFLAFKVLPNTGRSVVILLGCLLGILPDLAEAPFFFANLKNKHIKKLMEFQGNHQVNVSLVPGLIFQAIYVFILLYITR